MAQAVSLRFKFHFEGSRPTNKIDKVGLSSLALLLRSNPAYLSARMVFQPHSERQPRTQGVHDDDCPRPS